MDISTHSIMMWMKFLTAATQKLWFCSRDKSELYHPWHWPTNDLPVYKQLSYGTGTEYFVIFYFIDDLYIFVNLSSDCI